MANLSVTHGFLEMENQYVWDNLIIIPPPLNFAAIVIECLSQASIIIASLVSFKFSLQLCFYSSLYLSF